MRYLITCCLLLSSWILSAEEQRLLAIEFVEIPKGCVVMGSNAHRHSDTYPQTKVCLAQSFYLGRYEVKQSEWEQVMGDNPSRFKDPERPVDNVSWNRIQSFLERLNAQDAENTYRLPSESEWDHAMRAGTKTTYYFGDDASEMTQYEWVGHEAIGAQSHPVGQKPANPFGVNDMLGNVSEWVQDCYHLNYRGIPKNGTAWESDCQRRRNGETIRVIRGCSWLESNPMYCEAATRSFGRPDRKEDYLGFRLVKVPR